MSTFPIALQSDVSLKVATVLLTDAQVKTLPTTPVQLIPAPGAGKMIFPIAAFFLFNVTAGFYTNVSAPCRTNFVIDPDGNADLPFLETDVQWISESPTVFGNTTVYSAHPGPGDNNIQAADFHGPGSDWANKAMVFALDNLGAGNLTGGNSANTLKVTIVYVIVDA